MDGTRLWAWKAFTLLVLLAELGQAFILPWNRIGHHHHHVVSTPSRTTASSTSPLSSVAGGAPSPPKVQLTPELIEGYETTLQSLLQPGDEGLEAVVEKNLDACDYFFMGWLAEKTSKAPQGEAEALRGVMEAINVAMQKRLVKADLILRGILRAGDLKAMENALRRHFKHGDLDMAFDVLLNVNIQKALEDADDSPAAYRILEHLNTVLIEEKDKKLPPAVQLFKKLLRTEEKEAREKMLKENMEIPIPGQPKVLDLTKWGAAEVSPSELRAQIDNFIEELRQVEDVVGTELIEQCKKLHKEIDEAIAAAGREQPATPPAAT